MTTSASNPRTTGPIDQGNPVARHVARAAARLFASRGYDATSVRMIVEAAGVAKPTLYYYFGSKEGLAQALLTRPLTDLLERLQAILSDEADAEVALEKMIEAHFDFCREDPDRLRFIYALFFGPLGTGLAGEVSQLGERLTASFVDAANRLVEAGRIAPENAGEFERACRGMIIVLTVDHLYKGVETTPGVGPRVVRDLLNGFGLDRPNAGNRETRS